MAISPLYMNTSSTLSVISEFTASSPDDGVHMTYRALNADFVVSP